MEKSCLDIIEEPESLASQNQNIMDHIKELLERQAHWEEQQRNFAASQMEVVDRLETISSQLESLLHSSREGDGAEAPEELSEWEKQKAALLANYDDPNSQGAPQAEISGGAPATASASTALSDEPKAEESPKADPIPEPEEIAELRQKLEEKLRQSEIEISIERAKLARLQRELEENKTDMEREFQRQREELDAASKRKRKKKRWNRFLDNSDNDNR